MRRLHARQLGNVCGSDGCGEAAESAKEIGLNARTCEVQTRLRRKSCGPTDAAEAAEPAPTTAPVHSAPACIRPELYYRPSSRRTYAL
jgi:hypothetical protein